MEYVEVQLVDYLEQVVLEISVVELLVVVLFLAFELEIFVVEEVDQDFVEADEIFVAVVELLSVVQIFVVVVEKLAFVVAGEIVFEAVELAEEMAFYQVVVFVVRPLSVVVEPVYVVEVLLFVVDFLVFVVVDLVSVVLLLQVCADYFEVDSSFEHFEAGLVEYLVFVVAGFVEVEVSELVFVPFEGTVFFEVVIEVAFAEGRA